MKSLFPIRTTIQLFCLSFFLLTQNAFAQAQMVVSTNVVVRIMAANLTSGNNQRYESPGLNILKALKPDVVAIQEFNYAGNSAAEIKFMVTNTFGTNFQYFRETGYSIPNGIISRYPILTNGSWIDSDTGVNDRGFAWAQIDLPGTNDLYVVSVHLKASSGSSNVQRRTAEADELSSLIASNFPSNAWIVVAGDMNLYSDTEGAIQKFKTYLSDSPAPVDQNGNENTNSGRDERYDRVLPSFSLNSNRVATVLGSRTFSNGLVFDSRVYTPLSEVAPVVATDSGASGMQHMGVVKDFKIPYAITNIVTVPRPVLRLDSSNVIRWQGLSNVSYSVQASSNLQNFVNVGTAVSSTTNLAFTNQSGGSQNFFRVIFPE